MRVGVCIPICNPGLVFSKLTESLSAQTIRIDDVLIIDSSSQRIEPLPRFRTLVIGPEKFDHGGTRRMAVEILEDADVLIFLTQDAVLAEPTSLANLLDCFSDPLVGAAYGRQLPRPDATEIERHARHFNYPPQSKIKSVFDMPRLGLKAAFISNSFAAYRREALQKVDSFPDHNIVSEDTYVAARMLLRGWKVGYCAEATVFHSHAYSLRQEFQRYFDIGVFHAREPWIRTEFSGAEGEGWRFAISEAKHLIRHDPLAFPMALVRTPIRYLGFRAGLLEKHLPHELKARLSMQKKFWAAERRMASGYSRSVTAPDTMGK
jgi:rhamnosyltransferase